MNRLFFYLAGVISIASVSCNEVDKNAVRSAPANSKEAIKNAISLYPDSLSLVQNLIELYRNEGSYDSAITLTDRQLQRDSGNAYLWNMKATLHFENNDTAHAIDALEHAVDIYPLPEYLVALGTVYAENKNPKALKIAKGLLKGNRVKSGADAMFISGLYYTYVNDKAKAISYFDSSLHIDYAYMYSYREKAIALYDLGKYAPALDVLKKAVTIQNNFDEGYYWMGKCYEKLGDKPSAIQSYQTALLYDNDYTEAKDALDQLNHSR